MNTSLHTRRFAAALSWCVAATFSLTATAQTPIAYYNFNEPVGASTLADGNLNGGAAIDATYAGSGTASYGQGILGGAWRGTGNTAIDDYFRTGELTELNGFTDLSISVWVNPSATPGFDGIFTTRSAETSLGDTNTPAGGNWGLNQQGTQIDSRVQTGTIFSAGTDTPVDSLPVNEWTHVVSVYDSLFGENLVYINGALAVTGTGLPADVDWVTGGVWSIGNDGDGTREYAGLLDDLAVYNTSLSAADVTTIYNNGLAGQAIDGSTNPLAGDVNDDGNVDLADYNIILSNFTDTVADGVTQTRGLGDLTNDGVVDLADFRQWKDAAGSSLSATVPEPSALALLACFGLATLALARRSTTRPLAGTLAVLALGLTGSTASAQVVVTIDQDTGNVTVANPDAGTTAVQFDGYEFGSTNGLLDEASWANFENVQLVAGWRVVGTPSENRFAEALVSSGATSTFPGEAAPINFGNAFDRNSIFTEQLAAGLGVEVRDVTFGYLEPGNDSLTAATVEYVGETITNNLVLKVNTVTGNAVIENESPFAINLDGLVINSAASSLNAAWAGSPDLTTGWDTFAAADSLGQLNPTGNVVVSPAISGVVQASGSIDLGDIFTAGGDRDLQFLFGREGIDDGSGFAGVVEYISLDGDYNSDGLVNAADYTIWRDNLGSSDAALNGNGTGDPSGNVVQADYDLWANNFGAGAATASSSAAVPEPTTAAMGILAAACFAAARRK